MNAITDDVLHSEHSTALLTQLIKDTVEVLEQYGLFKPEQNRDIAKDLLFRICAVLDGSSYPGELNGKEIAPFVGFYLENDTEKPLVPENGAGMHAVVEDSIDVFYATRASS